MKSLKEINDKYEQIIQLNEPQRSNRLADLMSEMEVEYKIPALRNAAWENENRPVIAMYRKISMSRDLS